MTDWASERSGPCSKTVWSIWGLFGLTWSTARPFLFPRDFMISWFLGLHFLSGTTGDLLANEDGNTMQNFCTCNTLPETTITPARKGFLKGNSQTIIFQPFILQVLCHIYIYIVSGRVSPKSSNWETTSSQFSVPFENCEASRNQRISRFRTVSKEALQMYRSSWNRLGFQKKTRFKKAMRNCEVKRMSETHVLHIACVLG